MQSFGNILNATRISIAMELVNELGKSNKEVSAALGITPSAVSQYIKGKRGVSLKKDANGLKGFDNAIKEASDTIGKLIEIKEYERCQGTVLKIAQELAGISLEGSKTDNIPKEKYSNVEIKSILAERIRREHDSAMYFLGFAQSSGNHFARILFRQIATDSLRHADIVQALFERVDKPLRGELGKVSIEVVDKLLDKAKEHKEISINDIKERLGPEAGLLIESIEMDDREQIALLKKFRSIIKQAIIKGIR
jgi:predicted transcriptional regulator